MILLIKVDHPSGINPLNFSDLGGGIKYFSTLFFLVIHSEIQTFVSTLIPMQFC